MYKLQLKNFQTYKDKEFNISSLSFIVGSSDKGKSTIVRALHWLMGYSTIGYNKLKTRNVKGGEVSVSLTKDNITVTKIASDKGIEYIVKDVDGSEKKFERMGNKVPEVIYDIFKINENCFQLQTQPFFLINETPSEIYEKLSNPIIDTYLLKTEDKFKKVKEKKERLEEEKKDLELFLKKHKELKEIASKYLNLKFISVKELYKRYNILLYIKVNHTYEMLKRLYIAKIKKMLYICITLNKLLYLKHTYFMLKKQKQLNFLVNTCIKLNNFYKQQKNFLIKKEINRIRVLIEIIIHLQKRYTLMFYFLLKKKKEKLENNIQLCNRLYKVYIIFLIRKLKETINILQNELPEICPLCGNSFKKGGNIL